MSFVPKEVNIDIYVPIAVWESLAANIFYCPSWQAGLSALYANVLQVHWNIPLEFCRQESASLKGSEFFSTTLILN